MNETITTRAAFARENFLKVYGCAQSVLLAYADLTGLDETTLAKLGSSFGGGMGRLREVCGGVSGAFAVLGLLCGYDDPADKEGKSRHYADIRELARRFTERSRGGSIVCREILQNAGLSGDKGGEAEARTAEYYEKRPCPDLVYLAAEVLGEMLARHFGMLRERSRAGRCWLCRRNFEMSIQKEPENSRSWWWAESVWPPCCC